MTAAPFTGADRVAIIGAGVAGLACAARLQENGWHPTLFEKSRGLGGRLATRRAPDGPSFDHGGQYMTARSAAFRQFIGNASEAGAVGQWSPRLGTPGVQGPDPWYVGTPTMNAPFRTLADGVETQLTTEVTAITRQGQGWSLIDADGAATEPFRAVVVTTPAPQASRLLASEPALAQGLTDVVMAPCWSLMVEFDGRSDPGFDILRSPSSELAWVARDSSKPGRPEEPETWVAHAGVEWTQYHLEADRKAIAQRMVDALMPLLGRSPADLRHAAAHRWRYARTLRPLGMSFLANDDRTLMVAGDWCLGPRVECAFESGRAAADALMAGLAAA